jgi:MFS family permease
MNEIDQEYLEGNINKACLMNFFGGMWLATPVVIVFFSDNHMSLTQIGMILGAYPIMHLLFDIPSSIWADRYSRKSILTLGSICCMLQNIIYALSGSFELFFTASCINGIGEALSGGTFSALIYDTLLSLGKENEYEKTQLKIMRSYFVGKILAAILGAYVYLINPRAVFWLSAMLSMIHVAFVFSLKEPTREKSISKSFDQIREGLGFLFNKKTIWNTILIFAVMSASCDVLAEYSQPVLQASKIPVAYFGVIYLFASLFQYLGASIYPRIKSRINWKNVMIVYLVINIICSLFFSVHPIALVVIAILLRSISYGSQSTYISGIVHQIVPSSHRATTMSINNLIYMLFFLIFLNVVGFSMDHASIFIGMLINAFIVLIALTAFLRMNLKDSAMFKTG